MDSAALRGLLSSACAENAGRPLPSSMGVLFLAAGSSRRSPARASPAASSRRPRRSSARSATATAAKDFAATATRTAATARRSPGSPRTAPAARRWPTTAPFAALPFPGSVTVSCTGRPARPGAPASRRASPASPSSRAASSRIERTPTVLDQNGCPWQNLSVATTLKLVGQGELKGAEGRRLVPALPRPPGQVPGHHLAGRGGRDRRAAGASRRTPVDPQSLHVGEAVQLNEDYYAGPNLKANYKALQVEMGYDSGPPRVVSGVKRIDTNTVRLYVGDEDFVREALKLGVKAGDFSIGLGNTKDLSDGKLHSIDFDISGNAGWNAYQQFLKTGNLPHAGAAGTFNQTHASTIRYTDTTEIQAKLGGIQFGGQVNSSEGRVTSTHNPDGSRPRSPPPASATPRSPSPAPGRQRQPGRPGPPARCCCTTSTLADRRALPARPARSRRPTSATACGST